MRFKTRNQIALIGAVLAASGCATVNGPQFPESPAKTELAPIAYQPRPVGSVHPMIDSKDNSKQGYRVVEHRDDGGFTAQSEEGCVWSLRVPEAPVDRWEECGDPKSDWYSGTSRVTQTSEGSLWPLVAGNTSKFRTIPRSSKGENGTPESRECVVSGPVNIAIQAGSFDTMKIVCRQRRYDGRIAIRTWYWHPELADIKYMHWDQKDGLRREVEYSP